MWKPCSAMVVCALLALVCVQAALADEDEREESTAFAKLPAAVQEAVKKAYPAAKIEKCEKETEGDKVKFEVELKVAEREIELELDASGRILETEEEIAVDQLPASIQGALKRLIKGGKLREAEKKTKGGKTQYKVEVQCGKVRLELKLDGSGRVLRIEVEEENEHDDD